eukprot:4929879-Pyramimonas_sp.AAC.1
MLVDSSRLVAHDGEPLIQALVNEFDNDPLDTDSHRSRSECSAPRSGTPRAYGTFEAIVAPLALKPDYSGGRPLSLSCMFRRPPLIWRPHYSRERLP